MTDLFQHWQDCRFVVVPTDLCNGDRLAVLSDIQYWCCHADELVTWCQDRNANTQGMTVVFGDEKTLLEFVLKWS